MADEHRPINPLGLVSGGEAAITGTVVCSAVISYGVGHAESTAQLSVATVATVSAASIVPLAVLC